MDIALFDAGDAAEAGTITIIPPPDATTGGAAMALSTCQGLGVVVGSTTSPSSQVNCRLTSVSSTTDEQAGSRTDIRASCRPCVLQFRLTTTAQNPTRSGVGSNSIPVPQRNARRDHLVDRPGGSTSPFGGVAASPSAQLCTVPGPWSHRVNGLRLPLAHDRFRHDRT